MFPYPFSFLTTSETGLADIDNAFSMEFDGIDSYVNTSWDSTMIRSFSFWIKIDSTPAFLPFFCGNTGTPAANWGRYAVNCGMRLGKIRLTYDQLGSAGAAYIQTELVDGNGDPALNIEDGDWHHVVVYSAVANGASRADIVDCKVYLDKNLLTNDTAYDGGSSTIRGMGSGALIGFGNSGTFGTGGHLYLDGAMDEFAYWNNYELTQSDVDAIYDATDTNLTADLSEMTTPPTAWYRMGD